MTYLRIRGKKKIVMKERLNIACSGSIYKKKKVCSVSEDKRKMVMKGRMSIVGGD